MLASLSALIIMCKEIDWIKNLKNSDKNCNRYRDTYRSIGYQCMERINFWP